MTFARLDIAEFRPVLALPSQADGASPGRWGAALLLAGVLHAGIWLLAPPSAAPLAPREEQTMPLRLSIALPPAAPSTPIEPVTVPAAARRTGLPAPVAAARAAVRASDQATPPPVTSPPPAAAAAAAPRFDAPSARPEPAAAEPAAASAASLPRQDESEEPVVTRHVRFMAPPSAPSYPSRAVDQGMEGEVIVRALVRKPGRPAAVVIHASSGYRLLDEAARTAVERWQFMPFAVDGREMTAWVEIPIPFTLQ